MTRLVDQYRVEVERVGSKENLTPSIVSPDLVFLVFKGKSTGITYKEFKLRTGSPQSQSFWEGIYRRHNRMQNSELNVSLRDVHEIEIDGKRVRAPIMVLRKLVS